MWQTLNPDQIKLIKEQKQVEEQKSLAEDGISSAYEGNKLVTVGSGDRDYYDWKHFIVAQILRMGIDNFIAKTGWDKNELTEDLAEEDNDSVMWHDEAHDWFDAMDGDN